MLRLIFSCFGRGKDSTYTNHNKNSQDLPNIKNIENIENIQNCKTTETIEIIECSSKSFICEESESTQPNLSFTVDQHPVTCTYTESSIDPDTYTTPSLITSKMRNSIELYRQQKTNKIICIEDYM
jgi:hypothetical protein